LRARPAPEQPSAPGPAGDGAHRIRERELRACLELLPELHPVVGAECLQPVAGCAAGPPLQCSQSCGQLRASAAAPVPGNAGSAGAGRVGVFLMTVEELEQGISNPGELLRRERERVGFTAEEVAAHLHLSKTTLGYLEAGRFDRLPGDTSARGYVRYYARLLKLEPGALAGHYDRYPGSEGRDTRATSINRIEAPRRTGRLIMGVSTLVIVAGMLALGLWWWSDSREASLLADSNTVQDLLEDVQVDSMVLPESFREQVDNEADDSSQLLSEDAAAQITEQEQAGDEPAAEPVAAAAPAGVPAEPVTAEPETSAAVT